VPANVTTPANNACGLTTGPCGGAATGHPTAVLSISMTKEVIVMKNLNHFNADDPGYFDVRLSPTPNSPSLNLDLGRVSDTNTSAPDLYTVPVVFPSSVTPVKHAVLLASYVTKNANAPAAFYQCVDVEIIP
jgi:hypothetical protein